MNSTAWRGGLPSGLDAVADRRLSSIPGYTLDGMGNFIGPLCVSDWIVVDQAMIDRFAQSTLD